jgi:Pyruvate/2-oxoacid:ferredoxin oxidoreductase gamma subunit
MRIAIWFSWAAGTGVNTSGLLLGNLLASKGYTILGDKEYASIIKGDNNNFFLYISDQKEEYFLDKTIDFFFAFDDYAISKNEKIYILKNTINVKDQACKV